MTAFTIEEFVEAKRLGLPYAGKNGTRKTLISYQDALKRAERLLNKPISKMGKRDAVTLLVAADKAEFSQATKNQMIAALRGAFDWGIGSELIDGPNPFKAVRTLQAPRKLPKILTQEEIGRLLEAVKIEGGEKYELLFRLMAVGGLRIGEAVSLTKANILPDGIQIIGKGRKEAFCPIRPDLLRDLQDYASRTKGEYVFGGLRNEAMSLTKAYSVFGAALKRAGLSEDITPHMLRHSFAVHALKVTKRLEVVQDLLRHADPKTTRWYTGLTKDDLTTEYSKLWEGGGA